MLVQVRLVLQLLTDFQFGHYRLALSIFQGVILAVDPCYSYHLGLNSPLRYLELGFNYVGFLDFGSGRCRDDLGIGEDS